MRNQTNTILNLASKCKALYSNSDPRLNSPVLCMVTGFLRREGAGQPGNLDPHSIIEVPFPCVNCAGNNQWHPKETGPILLRWEKIQLRPHLWEAKGGIRCEGALTHSTIITWIAGLVTYFRPWQFKLIINCIKTTLIPTLNTVNFDHWLEKRLYFKKLWRGYVTASNIKVHNYHVDIKKKIFAF